LTNFGVLLEFIVFGRLAQLARAPALQAGSQGFKSLTAHCKSFESNVLEKTTKLSVIHKSSYNFQGL